MYHYVIHATPSDGSSTITERFETRDEAWARYREIRADRRTYASGSIWHETHVDG